MRVTVHWTPAEGAVASGATAIIVDVLRATTTLTVARHHGAGVIVPAATVEQAFELRKAHPGAWVCGERNGRKVEGFDRGNSPFEYMGEEVSGRTLIFASTNGSQAMLSARPAARRLLGAFVNAAAVIEAVASSAAVAIVCAGKLGRFALEDAACAAWLVARLNERGGEAANAAARYAAAIAPTTAAEVRAAVAGSTHGRYLTSLGAPYARDVAFASQLDTIGAAFAL